MEEVLKRVEDEEVVVVGAGSGARERRSGLLELFESDVSKDVEVEGMELGRLKSKRSGV